MKNSFASEILADYKKANKRQFIIILVLLGLLLASIGYNIYLINDIGTYDDDIIEIEGVERIDNSRIKIGDDIWEKSK